MTARTNGYRNGWRNAWLGHARSSLTWHGRDEYSVGYRLGYSDRAYGWRTGGDLHWNLLSAISVR